MPTIDVMFKDEDGFSYKHPERNCNKCLNFPCISGMDKLRGNFAAYGCVNFSDENTFEIGKPRTNKTRKARSKTH